ncbi:MAG: glycosyltransferase family 2 protein [Paracoccaceae bacterium]
MKTSLRHLKARGRAALARREIAARRVQPQPHGLDKPLVVSLTSYAARFPTLADTLRSLLRQTVRADRTVLWLTEEDRRAIPPEIEALKAEGLEFGISPNLRSFTKIVPALLAHPDSYIVTADDDLPYWAGWLEGLVRGMRTAGTTSVTHRAHRILLGPDGLPVPYATWDWHINAPDAGPLVFATGVLGVIYDAARLHPDATRADLFTTLCPSADDIWLYWMTRLGGGTAMKIGGRHRILEWPGSQAQNLRGHNLTGPMNDRALAAMIAHYGFPH